MNAIPLSQAPPEYLEVAWIASTCKLFMGVGWITNYIGMIYNSWKYQTYGMSLMPLCCNFAWELVYALIHPFDGGLERSVHYTGLALNCGVMYTAVRFAAREWNHAPLVQRNLLWIFVMCVAGWMSAHLALAAQLGPSLLVYISQPGDDDRRSGRKSSFAASAIILKIRPSALPPRYGVT